MRFKEYYNTLTDDLKEVASRNSIAIEDILKVTEYWNTEINSSLKGNSKSFSFYEENTGEINSNLTIDELKKNISSL